MKLVNEFLFESMDDDSVVNNHLKNIMKNAQALLDITSTGRDISVECVSDLAVAASKIGEIKDKMENAATEDPGAPEGDMPIEPEVLMPMMMGDEIPDMDPMVGEDPGFDPEAPEEDVEGLLPPAFPEEEVEMDDEFDVAGEPGSGASILDVETLYNSDEDE